jgi:tetratricopeptide (TPR) repeat protein
MPKNKDQGKSKQARRADEWAKKRRGVNWDLVWKVVASVFAFAGSMVAVYELVNYFRSDAKTFYSIIFPGLGIIIWVAILIQLFRKKNPYAIPLLVVTILGGVAGGIGWRSYNQTQEDKVIVLVAQFDGPEEKYGLHNQVMEDLRQSTKGYNDTVIIAGNEVVTAGQGSEYARELGKNVKADLVIWAWYRPTENPNITIHIENLTSYKFVTSQENEPYQFAANLSDLESFDVQKRIGTATTSLISFLAGYIRFQNDDCNTALDYFDDALKAEESSMFANRKYILLYAGECGITLGHYQLAIKYLDQAIDIDPDFDIAYNDRGLSYGRLGKIEVAIQELDHAISLNPNFASAYCNRAVIYGILGRYADAFKDFNRALEIDANLTIAYINRGGLYNNLGSFDLAKQDFEQVVQIDSRNYLAYNGLGYAYQGMGQYETAISQYDKAIQIAPDFVAAYINRGNANNDLGKYPQAKKDYEQAIAISPNSAQAYNGRGFTYGRLGQLNQAIADYNKAIQLDPDYAYAYNNRGIAYGMLKQYDRAIEDISYAIWLDPTYAKAYYNRGSILELLGRTVESEADFKKFEELTGQKP